MVDYVNVKLTVNHDGEIKRVVELLSRLCAEAYVGHTVPYNPSWCTVDVRLGDYDMEGPFEIGHAEITVRRKDAPLLRGLLDHVLGDRGWSYGELLERSEAYERLERDEEEARMQEEFRRLDYENDYIPSMYA